MTSPLIASDWFMTSRGGTHTKSQLTNLLAFIEDNMGTTNHEVDSITARDALTDLSPGDRVKVTDAAGVDGDGDTTVTSGWAIYIYQGPGSFTKVAEEESMDVVANPSNLGYVAGSTFGTVTNSNGSGFVIPAADEMDQAGLLIPADKMKLNNITLIGTANLDTIAADSHKAVTTAGTATTNPIQVGGGTGQELSFNIEALSELT